MMALMILTGTCLSNIIHVWIQINISSGLNQAYTKSNSHTFHNILARAGNSIFKHVRMLAELTHTKYNIYVQD